MSGRVEPICLVPVERLCKLRYLNTPGAVLGEDILLRNDPGAFARLIIEEELFAVNLLEIENRV